MSLDIRRVDPPGVAPEKQALDALLDYQRATLLMKVDGLDDEQLRRPMVPSGLSLLGLLKHAWEVEHGWFAVAFAQTGEPWLFSTDDDPEADFRIEEGESTRSVIEGYLRECDRSRAIVAGRSLDDAVPNQRRGSVDLRFIMLHMIEEMARHNGHADILREMIDGKTGH